MFRSCRLPLVLLGALVLPAIGLADSPIKRTLEPLVQQKALAGAVTVVATKDKVLDLETVGFADVAAAKPMAPDAVFWIASMTKPITATALMMLVDEGKVSIDDPVEKYLPEFKELWVTAETKEDRMVLRRPSHPITVREILSHTSGLVFKSGIEQPTLDLVPLRLATLSYTIAPLLFQPGTDYLYSNAGINTAGRLIEVLSGMPYEEFMEKRLFAPLGMKDTTFSPTPEQVQRLAKAYKPNAKKDGIEETQITYLTYPLTNPQRQPMPGGGLFSTAHDITKFCQMILAGGTVNGKRIISEASIKAMTTRQTPESAATNYGLGWQIQPDSFGHGGAYATIMTIHPGPGLITVLLVQHAGFPPAGKDVRNIFRQAALDAFAR